MPTKHVTTVTRDGITKIQPGMNVSTTSGYLPDGKVILNVSRSYPKVRNSFGGFGTSRKCDCDGMVFSSANEAFAFALDRGYLDVYYPKHYKGMVRA